MSMLKLKNIGKIYNKGKQNACKVLDGVDPEIEKGDFTAIIGEIHAASHPRLSRHADLGEYLLQQYKAEPWQSAKARRVPQPRRRLYNAGFRAAVQ